ncbi:MAG: SusC/RagA family TonB-linked outer membrane protein [Chitinophagales bacterium]|nr:SusC/RagA family TonB-linked outer membrane protein [Chitinophagales bacterium]
MKMMISFLLFMVLQGTAAGFAQISVAEKNASIQKVLRSISRQSGYDVLYDVETLNKAGRVSIDIKNVTLIEALDRCLNNKPLTYSFIEKTIVIKPKVQSVLAFDQVATVPVDLGPKIKIIGSVVNESNEPVIGASVVVKGTNKGVSTDDKGVFELADIELPAILVVSSVNIETREYIVNAKSLFQRVEVKSKVSPLDDIQIIGYGQTTRRNKTGAVSTVKSDVIDRQSITNPLQAIQGRVAGVSITQTSGAIGSGMEIRIRGVNTIEAGDQPLYIVDGAVMPDQNRGLGTAVGSYMLLGSTTMNNINPADIESIEILKDADATAIYGSRGANGVVLISTKKAKLGSTKFNFDVNTWANTSTYLPPRMNIFEYLTMRRDAFAMGNHNPTTGVAINPITPTAANAPDLISWDQIFATTDWVKYEFGNRAPAVNAQANLSGGDKKLSFYASAGYFKQADITRGSPNLERSSVSLSVNHTSNNDRFKLAFSTSFTVTNLRPSRGGGSGGLLQSMPPNMPMRNADGTPWWPLPSITQNSLLLNPLAVEEARTVNSTNNLIANLDISYRILPGLIFKTQFGYNEQQRINQTTTPSSAINPLNPGTTIPNAGWSKAVFTSINIEPQLSYTTKLGLGKVDMLLGSTFFDRKNTNNSLSLDGFTSDLLLQSWAAATSISGRSNSSNIYRFNSLFGRFNYNWDSKYLINLTFRRDGSSRFGPKKQWGDFGAVGLGWIFTSEKWMKNILPALSYGKIRGSFGTTGNDNISDYRFTSLYSSNFYNGQSGLSPSYLTDSSISWEMSRKLDLALELGFFNDRVLVSANWYRTRSTNLLASTPVPTQTGFSSFITNLPAVVENKGWEFELTTRNTLPQKKFQWKTNFNITLLKNQLLKFPELEKSTYGSRMKIGLPVNSPRLPLNAEWSQIYEGIDPATGLPIFTDLNKDGLINNNDRTFIGSAIPRTFGGLGNTLSYKGFELDFLFQFSRQLTTNWMFNNTYPGQLNNPVSIITGGYWKQPGDNARFPRLFSGAASNTTTNLLTAIYPLSSATLKDLLYVRLKNISLSYSFPTEFLQKAKLSRVVIYLRGQNIATWTSEFIYKDPEQVFSRGGSMIKSWTAGIQVTL